MILGSLESLLQHPVGQLLVTVLVAVMSSIVTVRLMMPRPAPAPAARAAHVPMPEAAQDPALVAAITAAVYATIGAHRIVYIGESAPGSSWTAEMRTRHHASHVLTRTRPSPE
jgi:hypothetical protein